MRQYMFLIIVNVFLFFKILPVGHSNKFELKTIFYQQLEENVVCAI